MIVIFTIVKEDGESIHLVKKPTEAPQVPTA
jgi:hypothetical protein